MNIVFLHGFLGNSIDMFPLASCLPYNTHILTLPYHGCSDCEINFSNINEWLEEQLINLKIKECVLYGYSLGGRIAANYVLNNTMRKKIKIQALICESSSFGISQKEDRIKRINSDKSWANLFTSMGLEKSLKDWYKQDVFKSLSTDDIDFLVKKYSKNNPQKMAEAITNLSLGTMDYIYPNLKNSSTPILYIYGENDSKYTLLAKKIDEINNSHLITFGIKEASHNCHLNHKNIIKDKIINFLSKIEEK